MLVMVRAAVPVLLSVTACAALVVAISWLPKLRLDEDKLDGKTALKAASETVCTLPLTQMLLSVTVSEPARLPSTVGVNVTLIVQLAPAATEAPQVLVSAKSPLEDMALIVSGAVPVLLSVTACATLLVPISWLPKVRLDEDK